MQFNRTYLSFTNSSLIFPLSCSPLTHRLVDSGWMFIFSRKRGKRRKEGKERKKPFAQTYNFAFPFLNSEIKNRIDYHQTKLNSYT